MELSSLLAKYPLGTRRLLVIGALVIEVAITTLFALAAGSGRLATFGGCLAGTAWFFTAYTYWTECLSPETRQRLDYKARHELYARRITAIVGAVIWLIVILVSHIDSVVPYAVGGALVVSVVWALLRYARATDAEAEEMATERDRAREQAELDDEDYEADE